MHRKGFSLASILLLTAVVAVLLAATVTAVADHQGVGREVLAVIAVIGAMAGALIGVVIGLTQVARIRGALLGLLVGIITGAAAGISLTTPSNLVTLAIGSLVLVLFGVVVRFLSDRPAPKDRAARLGPAASRFRQ